MGDHQEESSNSNKLYMEAMTSRLENMMRKQGEELHQRIDQLQGELQPRRTLERNANGVRIQQRQPRNDHGSETSSQGSPRRDRGVRERGDDDIRGMKLKVPPFHGKNDPDAYLEWEKKIEMIYDCQDYSGLKMVKLAATEFYGYAINWWDQITTSRRRNREPAVDTWEELKALMRKRFVPSHYHRELHQKLRRLTQGSSSVEDYFQEMESLMIKADIEEDDEATIARFLSGLNLEIQDRVEMQSYADLEEIYHKAILVEQQLKRRGSMVRSSGAKGEKSIAEPKEFAKTFPAKPDFKVKAESSTRAREIICFKCQGRGHIASECPNKRVMILLETGEYESEDEKKLLDSMEEQEEYAVKGDLLMMKKILNVQAKTEEEAQRQNLFHTRCHVQDKVCSLIIDGGSCTNVASEYMVKKLGLVVKKHPKPYDLHWLNNKGAMRVNSQVLVSLSIGKYEDEVLCDVLPMEASHILLGRPWQYDRRAIHDGSTNKYSFEFKGKRHTLVPMTPFEIYQDQKKKGKQAENDTYKRSNFLAKADKGWDRIQFGQIDYFFPLKIPSNGRLIFTNESLALKKSHLPQLFPIKDGTVSRTKLFQEEGYDVIMESSEKTRVRCSAQTKSMINLSIQSATWSIFSPHLEHTSKLNQSNPSSGEQIIQLTSQVIPSLRDSDIRAFNNYFQPNQKDSSYETNYSGILNHHRIWENWIHNNVGSDLGDMNFTSQWICFWPYCATEPKIMLHSPTQVRSQRKTNWKILLDFLGLQQVQEQKKWISDHKVITHLPKGVNLVLYLKISKPSPFKSFQTYVWHPERISTEPSRPSKPQQEHISAKEARRSQ